MNVIYNPRIAFVEWISTLTVLVGSCLFLSYKIEKLEEKIEDQANIISDRTDKLYQIYGDSASRMERLYEQINGLVKEIESLKYQRSPCSHLTSQSPHHIELLDIE